MHHDDYMVVNIRDYFPNDKDGVTREETLQDTISGFSCPLNQNVEKFLKEQAIEFAKKNQSKPIESLRLTADFRGNSAKEFKM